jgi:hypothetical protein
MEPRFVPALATLRKVFEDASQSLQVPIHFAVIGGLAVSTWGAVRATQDIDLLADSDPSPLSDRQFRVRLQKHLEEEGCVVEWRVGDPDDPIPLLLHIELPRPARGMGVDILWANNRWQREALVRSISLKVSRLEVSVLHPEDLILMKLEAGGPQDLLDVERLLANPPTQLNLRGLRNKAATLRLARVLNNCLRGAGMEPKKS